jgi:CARDB
MRRALLITALAAAALAALPAASSAGQLRTSVRLVECSFEQHQAAFRGSMRGIEGSARMAMRFTLLERTGSAGFKPLKAPGLGRWRRAQPGVVSFGYRQVVKALPENAVYKMRVDFRWFAADGSVLAQVQKGSPPCRQFSALPNLRVEVLGASDTKVSGVVRYRVLVTNAGRAEVTAPVRLSVDGAVIDTASVSLIPGEGRQLDFRGPTCSDEVTAAADPDGTIVESSEGDNVDEVPCPKTARRDASAQESG